MTDAVIEIMKSIGPCLSTELTRRLIDEYGLSAEAARKRVSRGCANLKKLAHLPFPRRARFLYLQQHFRSPQYWFALKEAILTSNSAYAPALAALLERGGIIPTNHFSIACGSPLRQKKHLSPETILARFKQANIIDEIEVPGVGACIIVLENEDFLEHKISRLKARLITEGILLKAIRMWMRNLCLVSFNKVHLRDENEKLPQVGTFAWDMTAPSYLTPMVQLGVKGNLVPGFITCDVLLGNEVNEVGLRPFLQKCSTLRNLKQIGRCLSLFVAESYTKEAFRKSKECGIVPATPETLFGTEVAEGLVQLMQVLTSATRVCVKPEVFDAVFERLGKIEGAATNLRGALFEYLAADLIRQTFSSEVSLNIIFRDDTGTHSAEVDVIAVQGRRALYFIECKGYQPLGVVQDDEVERWLTKRVPLVREQALKHPQWKNMEMHFELWTTGKLTANGEARIQEAKSRTQKYVIEYRDAARLYALARDTKDPSLIKTLRKHFLEHPLAEIERDIQAQIEKQCRSLSSPLAPQMGISSVDILRTEPTRQAVVIDGREVQPCSEFLLPPTGNPPWSHGDK